MKLYSIEDGEKLVRAARETIELHLNSKKFKKEAITSELEKFNQKYGVFVTIENYPTKALRGCIGFPIGNKEVKEQITEAAIEAASNDPRFVPVSHMEIEHIVVSVSILSPPQPIKSKSGVGIKKEIKIGRDGLILEYGYHRGLLLPIVPIEQNWNADQFLENLCLKAGLTEDTWKHGKVNLFKFSGQEFRELSPNGPIEEILFD